MSGETDNHSENPGTEPVSAVTPAGSGDTSQFPDVDSSTTANPAVEPVSASAPAPASGADQSPDDGSDTTANPSPSIPEQYSRVLDASDPTPASLVEIKKPRFDANRHHSEARSKIAFWLLGILTGVLVTAVVGFAALFFTKIQPTFDQLKSLLELVLTPLLTLVSAATGFYFGSQKQNS